MKNATGPLLHMPVQHQKGRMLQIWMPGCTLRGWDNIMLKDQQRHTCPPMLKTSKIKASQGSSLGSDQTRFNGNEPLRMVLLKQERPSASPIYAFSKAPEFPRIKGQWRITTEIEHYIFHWNFILEQLLTTVNGVLNCKVDIQCFKLWWQSITFEVRGCVISGLVI